MTQLIIPGHKKFRLSFTAYTGYQFLFQILSSTTESKTIVIFKRFAFGLTLTAAIFIKFLKISKL